MPRFDARYLTLEDLEWWLRVADTLELTTVPQVGYRIHRHSDRYATNGPLARVHFGEMLLDERADYFDAHRRAAALRWRTIGGIAFQLGDAAHARRALVRSLRAYPPQPVPHAGQSGASLADVPPPARARSLVRSQRYVAAVTAPVVSVVLPVYNAAHTVEAAASSILGQRLRELELIVVDDGSTDGTGSVLRRIDDPRLVVVRHSTNRGLVAAVRTGIEHTSTGIVARMDADDVAHEDRLGREYELLEQRPEVGLVATGFVSVDEHGHVLRRHEPPPDHASAWFRLLFANCLAHPTTMYRRAVFDAVGGYRGDCFPAEDHDLWLRMAEVTEIATIPEALLWYQRTDSSMSVQLDDAMEAASVGVVHTRARGDQRTPSVRADTPRLAQRRPGPRMRRHPRDARRRAPCVPRDPPGLPRPRHRDTTAPTQLARVLVHGGLRGPDGTWSAAGIARLLGAATADCRSPRVRPHHRPDPLSARPRSDQRVDRTSIDIGHLDTEDRRDRWCDVRRVHDRREAAGNGARTPHREKSRGTMVTRPGRLGHAPDRSTFADRASVIGASRFQSTMRSGSQSRRGPS